MALIVKSRLAASSEIIVAKQSARLILDGGFVGSSPKCRDLDQILTEHDVNDLETATDQECTLEKAFDLFRCCIGGDIEILGLQAKQEITNGTPDNEGIVAFVL